MASTKVGCACCCPSFVLQACTAQSADFPKPITPGRNHRKRIVMKGRSRSKMMCCSFTSNLSFVRGIFDKNSCAGTSTICIQHWFVTCFNKINRTVRKIVLRRARRLCTGPWLTKYMFKSCYFPTTVSPWDHLLLTIAGKNFSVMVWRKNVYQRFSKGDDLVTKVYKKLLYSFSIFLCFGVKKAFFREQTKDF